MMFDHVALSVADIKKAKVFFEKALLPLGIIITAEVTDEQTGGHGAHVGFGHQKEVAAFWIGEGKALGNCHVAFSASTRAEVDAFYQAAMAAGGTDNGKPGLRPHYHPDYYGAFVYDMDGNNIEAVCRKAK